MKNSGEESLPMLPEALKDSLQSLCFTCQIETRLERYPEPNSGAVVNCAWPNRVIHYIIA